MVQLGFNLMGHPNVNKDGKYNIGSLVKQLGTVGGFCEALIVNKLDATQLWFRLRGGNGSQRFSNDLFKDDLIDLWRIVQEKYSFKLIYTINYNDINDIMFYNELVSKGLKFHAIEFGNEQYLPKFRKTAKDDVTKCVTKRTEKMNPDKYIKLTREYIDQYYQFKLPMFIQFAPEGKSQSPYYKTWNDALTKIVNSDKDLHVTIHCYGNDYPYELITKIKKNTAKNIFVTEYGASDELRHVNELLKVLGDNDCMMSHELFNDYTGESSEIAWFHNQAFTKKGGQLLNRLFNKNI